MHSSACLRLGSSRWFGMHFGKLFQCWKRQVWALGRACISLLCCPFLPCLYCLAAAALA
ncbi:hypothetical protein GQ54DRAFT_144118 [Martensiomyces pterosporus]|nr:hypothetical protein GQ54DRAFT_144118 [Martensiomyces pterosporus]